MKRITFRPYLLFVWATASIAASAVGVDPFALLFFGIVGTPVVLLLSFLWPVRWTSNHRMLRNRTAVLLAFAVLVSVISTAWPLRLSYLAVRPTLRSLALRVDQGKGGRTPKQVGLFTIRRVERDRQGVVCLWTIPHGRDGFVRTSAERVGSQFNVMSTVELDDDWLFLWED